jgi:Malic enzyme
LVRRLGAAGSAIARLALAYGVGEVLVTDVSDAAKAALVTAGAVASDLETILREADIVIATTGRPGLIDPSKVRKGQVIFALSNPKPEIQSSVARAAGAAFAGDGRSINNALAFPGIFRGALQAKSRAIAPEMLVVAAETIASLAEADSVVPRRSISRCTWPSRKRSRRKPGSRVWLTRSSCDCRRRRHARSAR